MKMHPKAMLRHTQHVEPVIMTPQFHSGQAEPYHLFFHFTNGKTSRLTMTKEQAQGLYAQLAVMLRYEDRAAVDIEAPEFQAFIDTINGAIEGRFS